MRKKYPIVTLCGSTRFKNEFESVQKKLTLDGFIVVSVGLFGHSGDTEVWEGREENEKTETKRMLDDMHKHKILMADYVYFVNPGGYMGESTRSEYRFACMLEKKVRFYDGVRDWQNVDCSDVYGDVENAAYLAWTMTDGWVHQGMGPLNEPFITHKREHIYNPFKDPDKQYTGNPCEDNFDDLSEPFRRYGKEKMAFFVEEILALDKVRKER